MKVQPQEVSLPVESVPQSAEELQHARLSWRVSRFILLFPIWKLEATEIPTVIYNHIV
jgi:hypothetical protein